jgi:hypothetical protein
MTFNINDFRSGLRFGGARNTLFNIYVDMPVAATEAIAKMPLLAKAASLPASTLGTIQPAYMGRRIKLAGDRQFQPWNVQIINDEDFLIKNALEEWSNKINLLEGNIRTLDEGEGPSGYKKDAIVNQYDKRGNLIRVYKFVGLWPSEVSAIDLNWEAQDQIQEFSVTFEYDYFYVDGGNTGSGGGK